MIICSTFPHSYILYNSDSACKTSMKLASAVCWSLPHKWCVAGHVNESVDKSNAMSENCYMHAGDVQMIGHIHIQLILVTLHSIPIPIPLMPLPPLLPYT